ncbi:MAG: alcohol dehydrogenase catalytic domain-containing protein [Planctomycetota bacterium]
MSAERAEGAGACRAALFHGPARGFSLVTLALPRLAAGEALVRVEATTLCGSDLHSVTGRRGVPVPTLLGHEVVGRIDAMCGEVRAIDGEALAVGDRVVWSVIVACGACARCARGMPQKCVKLAKFGHAAQPESGARLDGGLAEFVHLPRGASIARVGEALPAALAAQATCAAATAAACVRVAMRASARAGSPLAVSGAEPMGRLAGGLEGARALIHGAGALGLFATALARAAGAREVHVVDVDAGRLELARALGATELHLARSDVPRDASRATAQDAAPSLTEAARAPGGRAGSEGFDVTFELTGDAAACERSVALAALGGTVVLAGAVLPTPAARIDPEHIVRKLVRIEGVHNYLPGDLAVALDALQRRTEGWPEAVTAPPEFTLDDVPAAFEHALRERPLRVVVRPHQT